MTRGLVIALGNPARGDDGFGPAVLDALHRTNPTAADLHRAGDDALALLDLWADRPWVIAIDAADTDAAPGTHRRLDLADGRLPAGTARVSSHGFGLAEAVELGRRLDRLPRRLVVHSVTGARFAAGSGLSPAVAAAVTSTAEAVRRDIAGLTAASAAAAPDA